MYVQHVEIEGLATAGGIQGHVADTSLAILKHHKVEPAVKWVDNFVFFQVPLIELGPPTCQPHFKFDLAMILLITSPLGIPWHPISKKGHNFASSFSYVGFNWDLPEEKQLCLLAKILSTITQPSTCHNKKSIASLHGSLQHVTLIYQQGHSHLPGLSCFLSKSPNVHILHHIPSNCLNDLRWWSCTLSIPHGSCSLSPLLHHPLDIWVDTSTLVSIGVLIGSCWAAWQLVDSWMSDGRDIGWAEAVAIELAVKWLTLSGLHNISLKINCDNTCIISSFWKGRSWNPSRNKSILRISSSLAALNLSIEPSYIQSAFNKADNL